MKRFLLLVASASIGCSSSSTPSSTATSTDGGTGADVLATAPGDGAAAAETGDGAVAAETGVAADFNAMATDFDCTKNSEWTAVGLSHYKMRSVLSPKC